MQFYPQAVSCRSFKHPCYLLRREGNRFAERIKCIGEPFARNIGNPFPADLVNVRILVLPGIGRQRMRAEKRRDDLDMAFAGETSCGSELLLLVLERQP